MAFRATSNPVTPELVTSARHDTLASILTSMPAVCPPSARDYTRGSKVKGPESEIVGSSDDGTTPHLAREPWGFVGTVIRAYCQHHNLVLRPDDVWLAILCQFSRYMNGTLDDGRKRAEVLRAHFVAHEGKRELTVLMPAGTLHTCDYGAFARRMAEEEIAGAVVDTSLVPWVLPSFSTTGDKDRVAAAAALMAITQAYFTFTCCMECGIPNVTLLGTLEDWRALRARATRLLEFNIPAPDGDGLMAEWLALLTPVLDGLVTCKAEPGESHVQFWDKVCHRTPGGSGPPRYSGWITAFAVFTDKGKWQGHRHRSGQQWPSIADEDLPIGHVSVPVKVVEPSGAEYACMLHAGHFVSATLLGKCTPASTREVPCTLQPRTDWAMVWTPPFAGFKGAPRPGVPDLDPFTAFGE